jgi:preprotein translocase subunit SecF
MPPVSIMSRSVQGDATLKLFPLRLVPDQPRIDFMRWRRFTLVGAALLALAAIAIVAVKGYRFALDFTGGVLVEARFERPVGLEALRRDLRVVGLEDAQVQQYGSGHDVLIRTGSDGVRSDEQQAIRDAVDGVLSTWDGHVLRTEYVGPQVGRELAGNGLMALLVVLGGFLVYVGFRFEWKFAVAASATTLFDLLLVAALVSLLEWDVDLTVIAGLLSVMGVSINDKIVVFDRVRENFRRHRGDPILLMNTAINQTLSRTLVTSLVIFLSVLALYLYGGDSLRGLSSTLMAGVGIATLSSILVACPLLSVGALRIQPKDLIPRTADRSDLDRRP